MNQILVGIDIGTSKVCTMISGMSKENKLEILGKGSEICSGLKKGLIVDIDTTAQAIKASVAQAEAKANMRVDSAYISLSGIHVDIVCNNVAIDIQDESREITKKDVESLLNMSRNIKIPSDRQIVDVIPRQFMIDNYDEIVDPVGMVGKRLELEADIVIGKITSVQNIIKAVERAGLRVDGLVIEALALSDMLLFNEEREMGVLLLDIGGSITNITVIKSNKLVFFDSIPVGGEHISNDISVGLKIPYIEAEKIKRQYELALTTLIKNDQEIVVTDINDNSKKLVRVSELVEIIEARVQEIFSLSKRFLVSAGMSDDYVMSVVLTGGGISFIDGGKQLACSMFDIPARVAPVKLSGLIETEHFVSAGMLRYIFNVRKIGYDTSSNIESKKAYGLRPGFWRKLFKVFSEIFSA